MLPKMSPYAILTTIRPGKSNKAKEEEDEDGREAPGEHDVDATDSAYRPGVTRRLTMDEETNLSASQLGKTRPKRLGAFMMLSK